MLRRCEVGAEYGRCHMWRRLLSVGASVGCFAGAAAELSSGWAEDCAPVAYELTQAAPGVDVFQCGDKIGDTYEICGESPDKRKQLPDEMSACECAQACMKDPTECVYMTYQEDRDHPERAAGPWKNTRCWLYKGCEKASYRASKNKWCIATGKISVAPPQHGWTLAAALLVCGAVYVGLGVAHGSRAGGKKPGLALHPHHDRWMELLALCADGAAFARGGARKPGAGYAPVGGGSSSGVRSGRRNSAAKAGEDRQGRGDGDRSRKKEKKEKGDKKERREKGGKGKRERRRGEREGDAVSAPPPPPTAPAPAPTAGTAAGDGGRWVHVPG